MKIKHIPEFNETISETQYGLFYPKRNAYILKRKNLSGRGDAGIAPYDLSSSPTLSKNKKTILAWQHCYLVQGIETVIEEFTTTITKINSNNDYAVLNEMTNIEKLLNRKGLKYLFFDFNEGLLNLLNENQNKYVLIFDSNYPNKKLRDEIKNIFKKTKIYTKDNSFMISTNDLTSISMAKLLISDKELSINVYDRETKALTIAFFLPLFICQKI
jgi:hypothetical protein